MRAFFVTIVVVAIGYLGWVIYQESTRPAQPVAVRLAATPAPHAPPENARVPASIPAPANVSPPAPIAPATLPQLAGPGVYYAGERISRQTTTGVKALHPGEEVRLMYRYKDGSMLVTNGHDEFVVKPATLTKDRTQALGLAPR